MNRLVILSLTLLLAACQTSQQTEINNSAPQATYRVAPVVPPNLREEKVEKGNAVVEFVVDPSGNVIDAYVVSTTHPSFGEAALQAVVQWKFIPEIQSGKPTATLMKIPFSFTNSPESDEAVMSDNSGISDLTK